MKAMEFTDASGDEELMIKLARDGEWVFQQKFDGTRVLVNLATGRAMSRRGETLKHSAAVRHMPRIWEDLEAAGLLGKEVTLDGELIVSTGEYIVFDLYFHRTPQATTISRLGALHGAFKNMPESSKVKKVRTALSSDQKFTLMAEIRSSGAEGFMAKHINGKYESGERVRHGLKFKSVKTADLVVTATSKSPHSATLAAYQRDEDGNLELVTVGGASLIGKGPIRPGDVVEVSYLYWTGLRLYQPRIVGRRADKRELDCFVDQFPEYSRAVVSWW